jgi:hypothetical protein
MRFVFYYYYTARLITVCFSNLYSLYKQAKKLGREPMLILLFKRGTAKSPNRIEKQHREHAFTGALLRLFLSVLKIRSFRLRET